MSSNNQVRQRVVPKDNNHNDGTEGNAPRAEENNPNFHSTSSSSPSTSFSKSQIDKQSITNRFGNKGLQWLGMAQDALNGTAVPSSHSAHFYEQEDEDECPQGHGYSLSKDPIVRNEKYIPWIILAVSFFTRYYRLADPPGVVFDEYHFGRFINQYNAGTYLFDIHPPLGKLVLLFMGYLFGYDYKLCRYDNIQDQYGPGCKFLVLRATAAFFGSVTTPLIYGIVRNWGGSIYAGILGASLFLMDNLNLTESRLILVDSQLIFWCAISLFTAQHWWRRLNEHETATVAWYGRFECNVTNIDAERMALQSDGAPSFVQCGPRRERVRLENREYRAFAAKELSLMMGEKERNLWCLVMGIVTSSAISIKWTALATPGMIAVESFFGFFFLRRKPAPLLDLFKILAVAFVLYFTWFAIHFSLLPYTGDGDAFMRVEFQRVLVNNSNYDPLAPHPGYLTTFFQLNQEMLSANARIDVRHNWESVWWEWPLNLRGILYYSLDKGNTYTQTVYLLGNPLAIWIVAIFVLLSMASSFFYLRYKHHKEFQLQRLFGDAFTAMGYCIWVYWLNLLPYILVARSAFIYHYMPALMYAEIMTAIMVDQLAGPKAMPMVSKVLIAIVFAGFLYYAPWVYALPLTSEGHARRRWYRRWD